MANFGAQVTIYENGAAASGYQVGYFLRAKPSVTGIGFDAPNYADVQDYAGSTLTFDTGEADDGSRKAMLLVQTPGRDPISTASVDSFQGGGNALAVKQPFFASRVIWGQSDNDVGLFLNTADMVKLWFVKVSLQLQWEDDTHTLPEKWIGGGSLEWDGNYNAQAGTVTTRLRPQTWWVDGQGNADDWRFHYSGDSDHHYPDTEGYLLHGYTDEDGIGEYRFLAAWAVRQAGVWAYYFPHSMNGTLVDSGLVGNPTQNVMLFVDRHGRHPRQAFQQVYSSAYPPDFPWALQKPDGGGYVNDEAYRYTQSDLGATVDYSTWNGTTGLITTPAPTTRVHTYRQGLSVRVTDSEQNPVGGATVSFGGYSGVTDAQGEVTIYAIPKGSTLAGKLNWLTNDFNNARAFEVRDASAYAGESVAYIKASTYAGDGNAVIPDVRYIRRNQMENGDVAFAAVRSATGDAFTVDGDTLTTVVCSYPVNAFDGGELLALPYTVTVRKGSTVRTVAPSPQTVVFEDELTRLYVTNFGSGGTVAAGDDLDWSVSPFGEPALLEAFDGGVRAHLSFDREQSFQTLPVLSDASGVSSPSQVFLADHTRLLAGIQDGAAMLWTSRDGDTYAPAGTLDASQAYAAVCLRRHGDGSLLALLVTEDGSQWVTTSGDGGSTWSSPVAADGLPDGKPQRGDLRYSGGLWFRLYALASGAVHLYTSGDGGETWTDGGAVASSGDAPWLAVRGDGTLHAFWEDGSGISGAVGVPGSGGAWTWSDPVAVATGAGAVAFANGQKVAVAHKDDEGVLQYRRTYDTETFEAGAYG